MLRLKIKRNTSLQTGILPCPSDVQQSYIMRQRKLYHRFWWILWRSYRVDIGTPLWFWDTMVCLWCFKGKALDVNRTQERVRSEISFSFKKDVVGAFDTNTYICDVMFDDRLFRWLFKNLGLCPSGIVDMIKMGRYANVSVVKLWINYIWSL